MYKMARSGFPNCSLQRDTANVGAKRCRSILLCPRWRFHIMFILAGGVIFIFLNPRLERYGNDTRNNTSHVHFPTLTYTTPTVPQNIASHSLFSQIAKAVGALASSVGRGPVCALEPGCWCCCRVPLLDVYGRVHFRACAAGCLCQICMAVCALEPACWCCCRVPH